jgi:hypothetical protein
LFDVSAASALLHLTWAISTMRGAMMTSEQKTTTEWTRLIEAEYLEMPGLHLTKPQVRRLWGLDPQTCETVLSELIDEEILKKTPEGTYALVR